MFILSPNALYVNELSHYPSKKILLFIYYLYTKINFINKNLVCIYAVNAEMKAWNGHDNAYFVNLGLH